MAQEPLGVLVNEAPAAAGCGSTGTETLSTQCLLNNKMRQSSALKTPGAAFSGELRMAADSPAHPGAVPGWFTPLPQNLAGK